eukprot:TRINITY_DN10274_c0_g1_i1.p1 TRINITY_DN10274_c0_g1~~TRINITY_DN10274_c0_g1_i1.p1  ORF type:complete len:270 (-),score=40.32 TRINITY_DN10274_c0_g1_i1:209-1018(-)
MDTCDRLRCNQCGKHSWVYRTGCSNGVRGCLVLFLLHFPRTGGWEQKPKISFRQTSGCWLTSLRRMRPDLSHHAGRASQVLHSRGRRHAAAGEVDDSDSNSSPATGRKRAALFTRAKAALLKARRRWGLGLVRRVVSLVVRVELMAVGDATEASNLLWDTLDAARRGITDFTGKDEYKFGDLTKAAFSKFTESANSGIANYTGKDTYEFGDLTKATLSKYTGNASYQFGDITKATVSKITGKQEYEFGDITRTAIGKISSAADRSSLYY